MKYLKLVVPITLLIASYSTSSQAILYSYSVDNPSWGNALGGEIYGIDSTFNSVTNDFSWQYDIDAVNDGFWLVVNDGPNPVGIDQELAILYGDLSTNDLTVYNYNGLGGYSNISYTTGSLIASFQDAISVTPTGTGTQSVSFAIDATGINSYFTNPEWEGVGFNELYGAWFHPTIGSSFSYDANGGINSFNFAARGSHDISNQATDVPEPETLALLLAGIGALRFSTRRSKKS